MKRNIYKLYTSAKQFLFAITLTLLSGIVSSQQTYTFNYTGGQQTISLPAGTYGIEMWGANGGNSNNSRAGIGGYSKGNLNLSATTTLYIVAGGSPVYTGISGLQPGGYNGGGSGYANATGRAGGGATHIASAAGILSALATNTSAVYIVAGGGGGDQNSGLIGHGGGLTGGGTYPGTQTGSAGGIFGSFGQGGDITASYGGGGGGGWYGGGGNQNNAGSGGSGYIGGVSSGTTIMNGQSGFVNNPDVNGNGMVIITELCSINLISSSSGNANPALLCSGNSLTITTNAVSNYSWSTGATGNSIVVAPTTNTVYSLTAKSPSNCIATANLTVLVGSGVPALTLAATPASVCVGDSVKLNALGAVTYTWSNGVSNNQLFPPSQTATYVVTGKNGCGTSTAAITVTALPLPVSVAGSTNVTCSGSPLTLTASGASGYTWSTGQTATIISVAPTVPTTYSVVGKKGGCMNSGLFSVSINPLPNVQLAGTSTMICAGSSVTLTATGGNNYTWTPSGFSGGIITDTPTTSVNYQVSGSNSFGCVSGANHVVIVNPLPTITVNSPQPVICPGATITLMATGGHTYQWNTSAQTSSILVNPSTTTSYTVTGTFTNTTCKAEAYITVNVDQPTLALSPSQTVCPGTVVTMSASGSGHSWSNGGTSLYNSVTVATPTMYTVSSKVLTANNLLCQATGTINLGVHPQPTVAVVATRTLMCQREKTTLTASGADSYVWQNTNQPGSTQTFSSMVRTTYTIAVIGTDLNGCTDTAQVLVRVSECPGFTENQQSLISVYPNPSAGVFTVKTGNDMVLQVLNEIGQLVRLLELTGQNQHQVQISGLPKGIYFIQSVPTATSNGSIKQKLIME